MSAHPVNTFYNMLYDDNPGIYITWDYSTATNVKYYRILKSSRIKGTYTEIAIIDYPQNDYLDSKGTPFNYYKVEELDQDMNVLKVMGPFEGEEALIRQSVYYQIKELLELQVRDEEALFDHTRTTGLFSYQNWNYWNPIEVRISGLTEGGAPYKMLSTYDPITTTLNSSSPPNYGDGLLIEPNYQGKVYFVKNNDNRTPYAIHEYDHIRASYQVRMFTVREMNDALGLALSAITALPGVSKINKLGMAPKYWDAALVSGACYYLLRSLPNRILNKQTRLLLLDQGVSAEYVKGLADTYKEDFNKFMEVLPKSKYPRIRTIVSPEFPMPGGRSRMYRQIWGNAIG